MLNNVILMGRLTADPVLKNTASGVAVTSFSLAVERNFADKQTGQRPTDFIDVVAWRGTAEFVCRYFRKGQLVAVQGSLQTRTYEDKDGNKRKAVEVIADNCYFAEAKKPANGSQELSNDAQSLDIPKEEFTPVADDDLPF
ncbi:MAG: single-stranded DNA-binding protein [Alistipes sp.]|nr:single-stranded DNA-binding protein [Alistipes sp.]